MSVDSALATSTKTSASRQNLSIQLSMSGDTSMPGLQHIVKQPLPLNQLSITSRDVTETAKIHFLNTNTHTNLRALCPGLPR